MQHAERVRKPLLPIAAARANPQRVSFADLPAPPFTGHADRGARPRVADALRRLAVLLPRLGAEGQVPGDPRPSRGAASCTTTRSRCSRRSRSHGRCVPRGVYGFWPARSDGDDVVLEDGTRFCFLRQQSDYGDSRPNRCLADYVAPHGDALGAFAVGIHGADELCRRATRPSTTTTARSWSRRSPTGSRRLSPSGCTPRPGRRGTRRTRRSRSEELIGERYRGIRPAFGYPACPDHSEKEKLFDAARRRGRRARADRDVRDHPGRERQRHLLRAPRVALLRGRPDRAATRSTTTRSGRACRSPRPSAGCGRTLATRPRSRPCDDGRVRQALLTAAIAAVLVPAACGSERRAAARVHEGRPGAGAGRLAEALRLRAGLEGVAGPPAPPRVPSRAARPTTPTSRIWSRPASTTRRTSRAAPTARSSPSRRACSGRRRWRRRGYARVAVRQLPACFGELFAKGFTKPSAAKVVSAGPIAFPKAGDRSNAYRLVASVKTPTVTLPVTADIVLFNKGRTDVAMIFLGIARPLPASLEQTAVARVLSRVTRSARGVRRQPSAILTGGGVPIRGAPSFDPEPA